MKKTIVLIVSIIYLSPFLFAQERIKCNLSFSGYTIDSVVLGTSIYSTVRLDSIENTIDGGYPELPVKYVRLLLPKGTTLKNLSTRVGEESTQVLPYTIKITETPISIGSGTISADTLDNASDSYPSNRTKIMSVEHFRGNTIVTIAVYPILYFPKTNTISFVNRLSLALTYSRDVKYKPNDMYFDEEDRYVLSTMVDNASNVSNFSPLNIIPPISTNSCEYVIVTQRRFIKAFNEFMDWKRRKGVSITAIAIEDILSNPLYSGDLISGIYDDAGKLRQFLYNSYQNGMKYVLLAGDSIPIRFADRRYSTDSIDNHRIIPADLYFSEFDGNWDSNNDGWYGTSTDNVDFTSEVYIGRIMPRNEREVKNWIRKIFTYEINPGNGDGEYLTRMFFTQADHMRENGGEVDQYWKPNISWMSPNDYTVWDEIDSEELPISPKGSEVINEFNTHYGISSFLAHGGANNVAVSTAGKNDDSKPKYKITSFDSDYSFQIIQEEGNGFDNMTNYCYPTIFYSMSCTTMPFDYSTPDISDFLIDSRTMGDAYTCVVKGGGPAYLGNTRYGHVVLSSNMAGKFLSATSMNYFYNLGKLESYSKSNTNDSFIKFSHNLMGCPETELWTAIPEQINNPNCYYDETTNKLYLISGTSGVKVCVKSALDNGNSYYNVVNMSNNSSLILNNVPKYYNATFTKHNYLPFIVNPENIFIQNVTWNDDRVISSDKFSIGTQVTDLEPYGDVVIDSSSNILLKMEDYVEIFNNFEVKLGANFEIKKGANYEISCE